MPLTELITWRPASEPPESTREVLVFIPGFVTDTGEYYPETKLWNVLHCGYMTNTVTHWAEMPKGPTAEVTP